MFLNPAYVHLIGKIHYPVVICVSAPNDKMYTIRKRVRFAIPPRTAILFIASGCFSCYSRPKLKIST
jgi:hypothetical protein